MVDEKPPPRQHRGDAEGLNTAASSRGSRAMERYLSTGELVRELGVAPRVLERLLEYHPELEPALRFAGKRAFSPAESRAIRRALAARASSAKAGRA